MKKNLSNFAMLLLPLVLLSYTGLQAEYDKNDTCSDSYAFFDNQCKGFSFGAEIICWKPSVDGLDYAVHYNGSNPGSGVGNVGNYKYVNPNWEPGARANLGKSNIWLGWDLTASYTWLKVNEFDAAPSSTSVNLQTTTIAPSIVSGDDFNYLYAKYKLQYQTFDVLLAAKCSLNAKNDFRPFCGLTGLFLNQKLISDGVGFGFLTSGTNRADWNSNYWGIGLRVGSDYRYKICDCFDFFASISGAIIAGKNDTKAAYTAGLNFLSPIKFTMKSNVYQILNGYHIQTGFCYENCWCNRDYSIRFGYEFVKWHNISTLYRYTNVESTQQIGTSASTLTSTLGFHGLFAGFNIGF